MTKVGREHLRGTTCAVEGSFESEADIRYRLLMKKQLLDREGPVLRIASSKELYDKLKAEGDRLEGQWHAYDAFNFVVTAWHLYQDWLPGDRRSRPSLAAKKMDQRKLPKEMVLVLHALRDLANGSKHLQLKRESSESRVVSATHSGAIGDWWAYFFQERIPGVTVEDTYYFSIRKLRNIVLSYFDWVFDDSKSAALFPGDLLWIIWRCAPKNRDKAAIPPEGSIVGSDGDPDFVT